ncbi:MAG: hypothetical protein JWN34_3678, partial [Bryobacterales bacterium]|nr:hypothetical protein [Bryobacterales bacterium]
MPSIYCGSFTISRRPSPYAIVDQPKIGNEIRRYRKLANEACSGRNCLRQRNVVHRSVTPCHHEVAKQV